MQNRKIVAVDLDGTLIKNDILFDSAMMFVSKNILNVFMLIIWVFKGRTILKHNLAKEVCPNVTLLPYNNEVVSRLKFLKDDGAYLVLATASHEIIAKKISKHLGFFDEVIATSSEINMAGQNKRNILNQKFGEKCYTYFGNSFDDFAVWDSAKVVIVVNPSDKVLNKALKRYKVKDVIKANMSFFKALTISIRPHQWMKNTLIFVPLLASHQLTNTEMLFSGVMAFIAFSFCASSVYILNDMLDIEDDRQHATKKSRPIAAGNFSLIHAIVLFPILLALSATISIMFLPLEFMVVLIAYYTMTLAYSFGLKKVVMLDVILLALLYTVRVIAGATAMNLQATFWILTFCMFIFLSLAFVKRYTELFEKRQVQVSGKTPGRGYYSSDFELLSSLGGSAGYISVMVLALYINDFSPSLYTAPKLLWFACPLLLLWLSRVWLIAHRGEMHDDPVVFALKDRVSRYIGLLFMATFVCASIL